jgi:cell filamentation protein
VANYTYPGGDTLKNKFGATDSRDLERLEGDFVAARLYELALGYGPKGHFDANHLKAIHKHLFQDVYEWAGRTRDELVDLSDGTVATEPDMPQQGGLDFLTGQLIPDLLADLSRVRNADYLRGLPRDEFAARLADIMTVLNGVHPFRHGNGPTLRAFVSALADQAGHRLDFTVVSKVRMNQVIIATNNHNDPTMMRRLFNEISDPLRVAALRQAIALLERRRFPWNDRDLATLEPGQPIELTMVTTLGDYFAGRTRSRILIGNTSDLPFPHPRSHETFMVVPGAAEQIAGTNLVTDLSQSSPANINDRSDEPAKPADPDRLK